MAAAIVCAQAASAQERAPSSSASAAPLTLGAALDHARTKYPTVRAALEEKVAAGHEVSAARAAFLPQVNLLYQINRSTLNNITGVLLPQSVIPAISGPPFPETGRSAWGSGAGVLAVWRPFDFGVRAARVEAARQAEAVATHEVALTDLEVALATANAYLNLAAAQSLAGTAQANVERLQAFAGALGVLVENKLRPAVDHQQADAAAAMARTTLIGARANVEAQRATLAKLVGRSVDTVTIDAASLGSAPSGPATASASATAHPAAQQDAARTRRAAAELRALDRAYLPQIDLLAGASARGSGRTETGAFRGGSSGLGPDANNWSVGVQVTLPIGVVPAMRAQQRAQRARVEAQRSRYDATLGDLAERRARALAELAGAREVAANTPLALAAARTGAEQQRARFRSGLATVVDVTIAEAALAQAESQDAIARLNVWRAVAELSAAEGDFGGFRAAVGAN